MEPYFDLNFNLTQNTQFQLSPVNSVTDEMLLNLEESTFLCEDDKFLCKTDTEKAIGDERFVCATNAEINQIKANRVPENTKRNTQWGFNTYQSWAQFRNTQEPTLLVCTAPYLWTWLLLIM